MDGMLGGCIQFILCIHVSFLDLPFGFEVTEILCILYIHAK